MRQVALSNLPGLSAGDLDAILEKVDNARWLVELLRALSDVQEHFVDRDRNKPLSALGTKRLGEYLSQQGYIGVIRQRLRGDAMCDVRQVLGATAWHAYGLEFMTPLAEAFEARLIALKLIGAGNSETSVKAILRQALDPASLIEGNLLDGELGTLIRFPERGYLQAAREEFDSSHVDGLGLALGERLIEWMESGEDGAARWRQLDSVKSQKTFLGIAIEVLGQLMPSLSPEQESRLDEKKLTWQELVSEGDMTREKFEQKVLQAKAHMLAETSGPRLDQAGQFQAIAMAELVHVLHDEGHSQAWTLADTLAMHPDLNKVKDQLDSQKIFSLLRIWSDNTKYWAVVNEWLNSNLIVGKSHDYSDAASLVSHALRLLYLGEFNEKIGNKGIAKKNYEASYAAWGDYITEHGVDSESLLGKSATLAQLAGLDVAVEEFVSARKLYMDCFVILSQVLDQYGANHRVLVFLTKIVQELAKLDAESGDVLPAKERYELCLANWNALLTLDGVTSFRQHAKSTVLLSIGDLDCELGNMASARLHYEACLEIREELLRQNGPNPLSLRDMLVILERVGDLNNDCEDIDSARQNYEEMLAINELLLTKYGVTHQRLQDKTVSLDRLAGLFVNGHLRDTVLARKMCEESLSITKVLIAQLGPRPDLVRNSENSKMLLDLINML